MCSYDVYKTYIHPKATGREVRMHDSEGPNISDCRTSGYASKPVLP